MSLTLPLQPQQVNLFDPSLRPRRETFSARQLTAWLVIVALTMGAIGWWATREARELRQEIQGQAAPRPAADPRFSVQHVAAVEASLRDRQAQLAARQATLEGLRRGMAGPGKGPSGVMQIVADTIPAEAWITELRVSGSRLEAAGRALEAAAVQGWIERLRASGVLAAQPAAPAVKIERVDPAANPAARGQATYAFQIAATLAEPFAEDRP